MGHQAAGTVRKGCIGKAPLESDVALKRNETGTFDMELMGKAILSADGMITVLSLLPHLVLVLIPCVLSVNNSQKLKNKIQVQEPNMIKVYNHFMGGVHRADENTRKCRASICGKY
jgi:DNA excision repair protein ERCC-6